MTQHHHMPPPDPMPLDPEERALAARLARLGPHGEPSPALDARVLAAAHAATSGGGARASGVGQRDGAHGWRRARWPVGVGVAASVVLAAGIAWQMRPLPAPVVPMAETATVAAASEVAQPSPIPPGPPPPPETFATAAAPEATATAAAKPADAGAAVAAKALAPPPPAEPPVVFDEPSPADVQAAPPAPPAPPAPMAASAPAAAAAATTPVAAQKQQAAARAATSATQAQEAPLVFEADAPEADVPPATAASPEVRDAWLARIRELAAGGRMDEARASLAEFRRRYPAFAIPADLRPLLPASPAPAPAPPSPSPQQ